MTDLHSIAAQLPLPKWTQTPEEILTETKALIAKDVAFHDQIAAIEEPTVENVLIPTTNYENSEYFPVNKLTFYQYVSPDKAVRDASTEAENLLDQNSIEQNSRIEVFRVYKKLWEKIKDSDVVDAETLKFLEKTVKYYKRNGLDLPEEKRDEVKKLKLRLADLQTKFSKNTNEENGHLEFSLEDLDGVPPSVIEQFEKTDQGKYKVTFKYPDILPVLKYAKKEETRKLAYVENQNKVPENAPILKEIVEIRFKLAKLLGYETYSEFVLEERLAKNQKTVLSFLDDLKGKLSPLGEQELQKMKAFKKKYLEAEGLPAQDEYFAWDHSFYNNLLLEQEHQVDHQKISEYFPLDQTISKMLGFYETLFDVKFVSVDNSDSGSVWHQDVRKFALFSNIKYGEPKNEFRGWIFFDLHPREGKYTHAAEFELEAGYEKADGSRQTPFCSLVCNFTKPKSDKPSLLKHDEVTTFFHELGHGVHSLLSKTKHVRFHGTHVPRDFVECPSQMLEFWTWSPNELKELSSHYETGEPLAEDLLDKLIKSKHVNTGLANLRQLHFALFDMNLHTIAEQGKIDSVDLDKLWNELREELTFISNGGVTGRGYATFGHIAGGYESGYYGYLYSQVFATDIYYTHFKSDPMNVERGLQYRDTILKNGGSKEVLDILKELLGREPNSEAFMAEILGSA
ncbi:hypothetical protein FT663_01198 [Candidozyma haemuli var. vulneris]|uniref:Peptidase M3A/M3B catalytic domain-containing protein n=1 Tax=Candidozyma haemuli TaxID=45357 RepID=A0A2V1AX86_9ASCO|nr:hypothetical protein CXQ85_005392 [[Candida] haemuloni]KAF3992361.1 hypothetical protein FT662_01233 [[Candida] haemuloni var. vulneris]KAF3994731.1 hypothetical protein FT663_01198 [[Candida] haemuloni var. vulneris]PVH22710.1 hypothetical protein CXQ85_005392 [[Candida] haemuloni]